MATIQDRWHRKNRETGKLERTALYWTGKRYRPHFRDPSGREVTKAFDRKVDAQRWLDEQTVALVHGSYVHPERSRLTVDQWAETWLAGRPSPPHAEDAGQLPLAAVHPRPADVGAGATVQGGALRRRHVGRSHACGGPVGEPDATGVARPDLDAGRRRPGWPAGP